MAQYKEAMNAQGYHVRPCPATCLNLRHPLRGAALRPVPAAAPMRAVVMLLRRAAPHRPCCAAPGRRAQLLRKSALQVWNWAEVNEERNAARDEDGAGGDHYYGGAAAACDASADGGLADIIAEALNTGAGACSVYSRTREQLEWGSCVRGTLAESATTRDDMHGKVSLCRFVRSLLGVLGNAVLRVTGHLLCRRRVYVCCAADHGRRDRRDH